MESASTQSRNASRAWRRSSKAGNAGRWTVGIVTTIAMGALLIAAIAYAPTSIRENNARCLAQVANEEHMSLEAFFQNPAEQDAFVQAVTICTR